MQNWVVKLDRDLFLECFEWSKWALKQDWDYRHIKLDIDDTYENSTGYNKPHTICTYLIPKWGGNVVFRSYWSHTLGFDNSEAVKISVHINSLQEWQTIFYHLGFNQTVKVWKNLKIARGIHTRRFYIEEAIKNFSITQHSNSYQKY
jgi:hypothetical protein